MSLPRLPRIPGLATVDRVPTGRIIDLPGRGSTYVVDSGPADGPTYVLLHSLACTGLMTWCPVLDVVRQFGRVVVFDQRGHGQGISSPRFLLEDCADDVAAVADAGHARCTLQPDKFGPGLHQAVDSVHRRAVALSA